MGRLSGVNKTALYVSIGTFWGKLVFSTHFRFSSSVWESERKISGDNVKTAFCVFKKSVSGLTKFFRDFLSVLILDVYEVFFGLLSIFLPKLSKPQSTCLKNQIARNRFSFKSILLCHTPTLSKNKSSVCRQNFKRISKHVTKVFIAKVWR